MDKRNENINTGGVQSLKERRIWRIKPDIQGDFCKTPFRDHEFDLIIFDPPHTVRKQACEGQHFMFSKYGFFLESNYRSILKDGFKELFRILKPEGILILKWSDIDKKVGEILKLSPYPPMFGTRTGQKNKTHWVLFIKYNQNKRLIE
jgi:SAM-dependent methyltransferase